MVARRLAIPRALTVKGKRWRVILTKHAPDRGLAGECSPSERAIRIRRRQTRKEQELTLVHEWLHAAWPDGIVSPGAEERLIRRLETPLRALLLSGDLAIVPEEAR